MLLLLALLVAGLRLSATPEVGFGPRVVEIRAYVTPDARNHGLSLSATCDGEVLTSSLQSLSGASDPPVHYRKWTLTPCPTRIRIDAVVERAEDSLLAVTFVTVLGRE